MDTFANSRHERWLVGRNCNSKTMPLAWRGFSEKAKSERLERPGSMNDKQEPVTLYTRINLLSPKKNSVYLSVLVLSLSVSLRHVHPSHSSAVPAAGVPGPGRGAGSVQAHWCGPENCIPAVACADHTTVSQSYGHWLKWK